MTSSVSLSQRTSFVEEVNDMSIQKQCKLLGVPRSSYYHKSERKWDLNDELLMQAIDRIYMEEPTYGSRRMLDELRLLGYKLGRDRVRRLMRTMGIEAHLSEATLEHSS